MDPPSEPGPQPVVSIETDCASLSQRIDYVKSGTQSRSADIYRHALIERRKAGIYLRSFNQFAHSIVRLSEDGGPAEEMLVDLGPLSMLVGSIEGPVSVEIDFDEHEVRLRGPAKLDHRCQEPGEDIFISFPDVEGDYAEIEDNKNLSDRVKRAATAVEEDAPQMRFRGVYVESKDNQITLAGTNGTVITELTLQASIGLDESAILYGAFVDQLCVVLEADNRPMMHFSDRHLATANGDFVLVASLMEAKFPNYRTLIDSVDEVDRIIVDRKRLMKALRVTKGYADEYQTVYLDFNSGDLTVTSVGSEQGTASFTIPVEGDDLTVRLKASAMRMRQTIDPLAANRIVIEVPTIEEPKRILLRPENDDTAVSVLSLMFLQESDLS